MSLDMETGVYIEPKGDPKTDGGMCVLSVVFVIVGAITIVAGLICGINAANSYSTRDFTPFYIAGGIFTGLLDFALAVIVDACDKYRKK